MALGAGAVIVKIERMVNRQGVFGVAVYDITSGKELWRRDGSPPVHGTPLFLANGKSFERVDIRTSRVLWRSTALCSEVDQNPSYVKIIGVSVYAGCDGAELFRLGGADGRILASQKQISVDKQQRVDSCAWNAGRGWICKHRNVYARLDPERAPRSSQ